jgi:hypothetical protein
MFLICASQRILLNISIKHLANGNEVMLSKELAKGGP